MLSEHLLNPGRMQCMSASSYLKRLAPKKYGEIWKSATAPRMSGKLFAPQMVITEVDDSNISCISSTLQFALSSLHTTSPWAYLKTALERFHGTKIEDPSPPWFRPCCVAQTSTESDWMFVCALTKATSQNAHGGSKCGQHSNTCSEYLYLPKRPEGMTACLCRVGWV